MTGDDANWNFSWSQVLHLEVLVRILDPSLPWHSYQIPFEYQVLPCYWVLIETGLLNGGGLVTGLFPFEEISLDSMTNKVGQSQQASLIKSRWHIRASRQPVPCTVSALHKKMTVALFCPPRYVKQTQFHGTLLFTVLFLMPWLGLGWYGRDLMMSIGLLQL